MNHLRWDYSIVAIVITTLPASVFAPPVEDFFAAWIVMSAVIIFGGASAHEVYLKMKYSGGMRVEHDPDGFIERVETEEHPDDKSRNAHSVYFSEKARKGNDISGVYLYDNGVPIMGHDLVPGQELYQFSSAKDAEPGGLDLVFVDGDGNHMFEEHLELRPA